MADNRANNPEACVDPKAPFECASNADVITVTMREVREAMERGEKIPSITAAEYREQHKPKGFE